MSLKKLYCDKKQRSTSIWISILFACSLVIYFLGMFNSAALPGNLFTNQILCGSMLGVGNLIGGVLADYNDSAMMQICLGLVIFFSVGIKLPGLGLNEFYFLYVCQIIVLGSLFSVLLILQDRRVEDTFASMSLEINLSIGSFLTCLSPPFARMPEPQPTIFIIMFCLTGILAVHMIGKPKPNRNMTVQRAIADLSQTYNVTLQVQEDVKNRWTGTGDKELEE